MAQRQRSLSALAPLFTLLNWIALLGWSYVLAQVLAVAPFDSPDAMQSMSMTVRPVVLALEGICLVEVARIAVGDLAGGSLLFGSLLHAIRITMAAFVLGVRTPVGHWTPPMVYFAWSVTEVTRYPMYVVPGNAFLRKLRLVVPIVTFPMGLIAEGWGAIYSFRQSPLWLQPMLVIVLVVQGVLGPTMAYPLILEKGMAAFTGKSSEKSGPKSAKTGNNKAE